MRRGLSVMLVALVPFAASGAEPGDDSIEARCEREIVELHQFLEAWSNADLPDEDGAFGRFGGVLDPSFVLVDPDGEILDREVIVGAIRTAHGRWRAAPGRIRIADVRVLQSSPDGWVLATYEEWHEQGERSLGRLSSVLFGPDPKAPNGLTWLHLHEVWLAPPGSTPP